MCSHLSGTTLCPLIPQPTPLGLHVGAPVLSSITSPALPIYGFSIETKKLKISLGSYGLASYNCHCLQYSRTTGHWTSGYSLPVAL